MDLPLEPTLKMKKYCYIKEGKIEKVDTLPTNWSNVSNFHLLTDEELKCHGWLPVEEQHYSGDLQPGFHILEDKVIQVKDSEPSQQEVINNSQSDIINPDKSKTLHPLPTTLSAAQEFSTSIFPANDAWKNTRIRRNLLLRISDKYMLMDFYQEMTPEQQQAMVQYRKQLRDIPQKYSDAESVEWPEIPAHGTG
jgi:hypothetical protein